MASAEARRREREEIGSIERRGMDLERVSMIVRTKLGMAVPTRRIRTAWEERPTGEERRKKREGKPGNELEFRSWIPPSFAYSLLL